MDYIYRIEVDCFKWGGKYEWNLLSKSQDSVIYDWQICAVGYANTQFEAFNEAYLCKEKFLMED